MWSRQRPGPPLPIVLYVSHTPAWGGGGEVSLHLLIRCTNKIGFDPVLVGPPGSLAERLANDCVVIPLPLPWLQRSRTPVHVIQMMVGWIIATLRLVGIFRRMRPEIVHANAGVSALISCVACAFTACPLIWHQRDIVPPRLINRIVLGACSRLSTMILATSGSVAQSLEALGISRDKIRVFYPSVNAEILRASPPRRPSRAELGIADETVVITVIGRLVVRKAQDVFLESVRQLAERGVDVCALLVGAAPPDSGVTEDNMYYLERLHDLADSPALRGRVHFMGQRDDVSRILSASDILVMPSYNEPLGIVMLEGFAARVPVVAVAAGGPLEVIDNGVDGLLVPPGDAEALAEAYTTLLSDPELRARVVASARRKVEQEFSELIVPDRLAATYSDVLRWKRQGHPDPVIDGQVESA